MREKGYYWVQQNPKSWIIGKFHGFYWTISGDVESYHDSDFYRIGDKVNCPKCNLIQQIQNNMDRLNKNL